MKLRIVHFYPEHLNANSDEANIRAFQHRASLKNIQTEIIRITPGPLAEDCIGDILLFNNGLKGVLTFLVDDLKTHKKDILLRACQKGAVILGINNGFRLLGEEMIVESGQSIIGPGLLPIKTIFNKTFYAGPALANFGPLEKPLVGFENHEGIVQLHKEALPFAEMVIGYGNSGQGGPEGCLYNNIYATHLHGPFLLYNPHFTDYLLAQAMKSQSFDFCGYSVFSAAEEGAYEEQKERAVSQGKKTFSSSK